MSDRLRRPLEEARRLDLALYRAVAETRTPAIDVFPGRIDGLWAALGLFPVVLKRPAALVLSFVDLVMRMQPAQRIVSKRAQGDDLLPRLQRQWIVNFNRRHFGVAWQIVRSPVMNRCRPGLLAFCSCHLRRSFGQKISEFG